MTVRLGHQPEPDLGAMQGRERPSAAGAPPAEHRRRRLAIIIVTYNSAQVVAALLDGLGEALDATTHDQVIIVDNASDDDTLDVVGRAAPAATVVCSDRNLGYAAAINVAVSKASGADAVLVLNPDLRIDWSGVLRLLEALDEPGVGISVPHILEPDGRTAPSLRREPTVLRALGEAMLGGRRAGRFSALGELVLERNAEADWATGACLMISRECLDAVGAWDETFFLYSEETDFALRARDLGFSLRYVPDAEATHEGGSSMTDPLLFSLLTLNRYRLHRKRQGALPAAVFRGALMLGLVLRFRRTTNRRALAVLMSRRIRQRALGDMSPGLAPRTSSAPRRRTGTSTRHMPCSR
jgi:N-acetylglucosaminyl-diphospho-decaprenol L-rhamnosyltransferase